MARLFDSEAFGQQVGEAITLRGLSLRAVAGEAQVSPATLQRVRDGWPHLSHENYLRLRAWLRSVSHVCEQA